MRSSCSVNESEFCTGVEPERSIRSCETSRRPTVYRLAARLHLMRRIVHAVLIATHDLISAKESGTRVGIMKHGRLVKELSTDELGHADLE